MGQKDPTKSINRNTRREEVMPERYRNIAISRKDLTDASSQGKPERELGPYEIFITTPQLKREVGTCLIDTGAQVSLVKGGSLERNIAEGKYRDINVSVEGINEGDMYIKKGIMMQFNNSREMLFYIVERLPRNLDVILGQEWLLQNDYVMTYPKVIPPFSENIKVPTKERGVRLVDKQGLLPGVYCGTSLSLCQKGYFQCLIVNMTQSPITQLPLSRLEKPPTPRAGGKDFRNWNNAERISRLDGKLRLGHSEEGADAIRALCKKFVDIFKLPGDKLTASSAAEHHITPAVPEGRRKHINRKRMTKWSR
jgi:hypothetical protein